MNVLIKRKAFHKCHKSLVKRITDGYITPGLTPGLTTLSQEPGHRAGLKHSPQCCLLDYSGAHLLCYQNIPYSI